MVALSKKALSQQSKSKSTIAQTKLMIAFVKIFLILIAGSIIGTNLAGFEISSSSSSLPSTTTTTTTVSTTNAQQHHVSIGGDEADHMHVVFSTACSLSHDWQSYLFFFHAMLHKQRGDVTRIVSGCSPEDEIKMRELHEKQFSVMSPNFLIHFTPEYGKQLVDEGYGYQKTKYWNKPFGLKHWMEHRFGYVWNDDDDTKITVPEFDDHIIVLVDPDMLMQKPFVNDFSKMPLEQWNKYYREKGSDELVGKVTQGHPAAQDYSFGDQWLKHVKDNLNEIVGPDSLVHQVTNEEARLVYSAGPPYWMTARDTFRISYKWTEFLPGIFRHHPEFMSEMYGYCMAAAHLGLRHQMARGMMVSNVGMTDGEGWSFLPKDPQACDISRYAETVPNVIHFCQRYTIGEFFINKYLFPTNILSCEHPLMELPPTNILETTWYSHFGDGSTINYDKSEDKIERYRNAFVVCSLFPAINAAATFYKDQHCDKEDPNTIYDLTYNHFRSDKGVELEEQGKKKRANELKKKIKPKPKKNRSF
jgi:hypothetical protein